MIIFPGQGSQVVGMGKDLFDNFTSAKNIFLEVDDALNQKLSDIIFNGSEADLTLTENTQPALMAVSMAVLTVLKQEAGVSIADYHYAAGHSLGEYSALCASGVFSLADTARLLKIRGQAMQQAVPVGVGAMAAILGLSFDDVVALAKQAAGSQVCEAANDNTQGQVVVSGHKEAIDRITILAKEAGAKRVVLLPVSAPFHCSLMQPAAEKMAEALEAVTMHTATLPIIANVLVTPISEPSAIKQALIAQVTGRVRWRETMQWAIDNDITQINEIGAGKVLSTLCKRAIKTAQVCAIGSLDDIKAFQVNA
ncbi:MAG: [acyl-carrier-protein] S-malonyltransferase [Alphaproteobacteria bacterium]|jgi:[acyl-carrier-protein] S-malonyltransferase